MLTRNDGISAQIVRSFFILSLFVPGLANAVESEWVQRGETGRLIYMPDSQGDRVPDFSDVGYQGGKSSIPTVAAVMTLQPIAGDNTTHIQNAINQVSAMPLGPDGFRGAILLEAGDYDIAGNLSINASGVVIRGVGRESGDTVLHATGTTQRDLIDIEGSGSQSLTGSTINMIDKVVPVGSRSFRVDSTSGFAVGDTVRVARPSTANWISDLGMDMIPPRSDGGTINQWTAGSIDIRFDRVITRIEGDRVFVDAPLTNAFELQYGGGQIKKYNWNDRIENVGIENLRAESAFASDTDENHALSFVSIDKAQNVWVRDTTSAHFVDSSVVSNPGAKWVTVDNAINLDPKSQVTGGRRYTFDLSGQLDLVTNSEANEGRHDFVNNSTRPAGPHVFHNSIANNALDEAGPHQRWATGSLFDNITVDGDQINARNRGNFGTGHGWAGANMVIWNSTADSYIVQNPPTAQNWLVGSTGTVIDDQTFGPQPDAYIDSHGTAVEIDSLYESQVEDASKVNAFHFSDVDSNWSDAEAWQQKLVPGEYQVEMRDYLIGDIDQLTNDGAASVDNAYVDPAWESYIVNDSGTSLPTTGFDDASTNKNVAFTIQHQLDSGERVVHGSLALGMERVGADNSNDFLRLFNSAPNNKHNFADLGWDTTGAVGEEFVGLFDIGSNTSELQTGSVNVQVNDDSAVDWAIYTITVAKAVSTPADAVVFINGGGRVLADSAITGVSDLFVGGAASGELAIASDGLVTASSDYLQASNGVLEFELGGVSNGEFGKLAVLGNAFLDGSLEIVLDGLYSPNAGDQYEILTADVLTGTFDSIQTPSLVSGLTWRASYTQDSLLLDVVLSGDYNNDEVVDAADYTIWRDAFGSTSDLAADGNDDGVINTADYAIWTANYGNAVADFISSTSVSVPEPSSFLITNLAMLASVTILKNRS